MTDITKECGQCMQLSSLLLRRIERIHPMKGKGMGHGRPVVEIRYGLPAMLREQAASLYYEAFHQKLDPIIRSRTRALALLEDAFDIERAFVAIHEHRLVGIAGMHYRGRQFINFTPARFVRHFGWLKGWTKLMLFSMFDRHQQGGELLMDGIVVHPTMRGTGVGTRLLQAVCDFARANNFDAVRLDVVDTNPAARRLYTRMGFVPTRTVGLRWLRAIFGFSASTTMVKQLAS